MAGLRVCREEDYQAIGQRQGDRAKLICQIFGALAKVAPGMSKKNASWAAVACALGTGGVGVASVEALHALLKEEGLAMVETAEELRVKLTGYGSWWSYDGDDVYKRIYDQIESVASFA